MTALQRLKKVYEPRSAAVVASGARGSMSPGLAGRLAIATGLLVVLAVGAMSVFAIGALRRLADAEGLTRVELAVSSAREGMRQSTEDLLTAARILGERPALQRLLRGPVPETFSRSSRGTARAWRSTPARSCAASELIATTTSESSGVSCSPRPTSRASGF